MAKSGLTHEQLMAYAAGEASPELAKQVREALRSDPAAAQTVTFFRQVRAALTSDDGQAPSPEAIERAKAIFAKASQHIMAHQAAARPGWLETAQRLVAKLIFDSRLEPVGLRHTATEDRINLTYETQRAELDLQAQRAIEHGQLTDRWRILGQVTPSDADAQGKQFAVLLTSSAVGGRGQEKHIEVQTDLHGTFHVDVPAGRYDIFIRLAEGAQSEVMVVPAVDLE